MFFFVLSTLAKLFLQICLHVMKEADVSSHKIIVEIILWYQVYIELEETRMFATI